MTAMRSTHVMASLACIVVVLGLAVTSVAAAVAPRDADNNAATLSVLDVEEVTAAREEPVSDVLDDDEDVVEHKSDDAVTTKCTPSDGNGCTVATSRANRLPPRAPFSPEPPSSSSPRRRFRRRRDVDGLEGLEQRLRDLRSTLDGLLKQQQQLESVDNNELAKSLPYLSPVELTEIEALLGMLGMTLKSSFAELALSEDAADRAIVEDLAMNGDFADVRRRRRDTSDQDVALDPRAMQQAVMQASLHALVDPVLEALRPVTRQDLPYEDAAINEMLVLQALRHALVDPVLEAPRPATRQDPPHVAAAINELLVLQTILRALLEMPIPAKQASPQDIADAIDRLELKTDDVDHLQVLARQVRQAPPQDLAGAIGQLGQTIQQTDVAGQLQAAAKQAPVQQYATAFGQLLQQVANPEVVAKLQAAVRQAPLQDYAAAAGQVVQQLAKGDVAAAVQQGGGALGQIQTQLSGILGQQQQQQQQHVVKQGVAVQQQGWQNARPVAQQSAPSPSGPTYGAQYGPQYGPQRGPQHGAPAAPTPGGAQQQAPRNPVQYAG